MNHLVSKASFAIIAVLLILGMTTSCGGGGGGGNQIATPPPVSVQSTAIDTQKVSVSSQNPTTWDFEGSPGAAMANAKIKAIDTKGLQAFTTANADGSFDFGPVPTGFDISFSTTILICQTAPGFTEGPLSPITVS